MQQRPPAVFDLDRALPSSIAVSPLHHSAIWALPSHPIIAWLTLSVIPVTLPVFPRKLGKGLWIWCSGIKIRAEDICINSWRKRVLFFWNSLICPKAMPSKRIQLPWMGFRSHYSKYGTLAGWTFSVEYISEAKKKTTSPKWSCLCKATQRLGYSFGSPSNCIWHPPVRNPLVRGGGHLPDHLPPLPKGKWPAIGICAAEASTVTCHWLMAVFSSETSCPTPFCLPQSHFVPSSELLPICELGVPDLWINE